MITIDGSIGEGGGHVLRTALAASLVTTQPFTLTNACDGKQKPGLRRHHIAAIRAAASICDAKVDGDSCGSRVLTFEPGPVRGGKYHFGVGLGKSVVQVIQVVLPALALADEPSFLTADGGTHGLLAPCFDFFQNVYLKTLARMGIVTAARLTRRGFDNIGGGHVELDIHPNPPLRPLDWTDRGELISRRAIAILAKLPPSISDRLLWSASSKLRLEPNELQTIFDDKSIGHGVMLIIEITCGNAVEVFAYAGKPSVKSEIVASWAADEARRYLAAGTTSDGQPPAGVPVGQYLADQLMLPMALAGGRIHTLKPSTNTMTTIEVLRAFHPARFSLTQVGPDAVEIAAGPAPTSMQ